MKSAAAATPECKGKLVFAEGSSGKKVMSGEKKRCSCCHEYGVREPFHNPTDEELLECFFTDGPEKADYRRHLTEELFPELRVYLEQLHNSDGFDIDYFPGFVMGFTPIAPLDVHIRNGSGFAESIDVYENLANLAINKFNKEHGTIYVDTKYVKVNLETNRNMRYFLTFTAHAMNSDSVSKAPTIFQTLIEHNILDKRKPKVRFCRIKVD